MKLENSLILNYSIRTDSASLSKHAIIIIHHQVTLDTMPEEVLSCPIHLICYFINQGIQHPLKSQTVSVALFTKSDRPATDTWQQNMILLNPLRTSLDDFILLIRFLLFILRQPIRSLRFLVTSTISAARIALASQQTKFTAAASRGTTRGCGRVVLLAA